MPYFMLSSMVPLASAWAAGAAGMKVSSGDAAGIPPELEGGGTLPCWHAKSQHRKLSVTGFLLGKGFRGLGLMSQLEGEECEMEPQVTVFPRDTSALAPSQQLSIHQ